MGKAHAAIKNEYRVTWELFKTWLWESRKRTTKLIFAAIWILLGTAAVWMAVAFRFAVYFLLALFCVYRAFFRDMFMAARQYAVMAKRFGQKDWLRIITFGEEQIVLLEGNISVNYMYSDIEEIKEEGNEVRFFLNYKTVIRVYKDCFVDSNWEECRALVDRKRSEV